MLWQLLLVVSRHGLISHAYSTTSSPNRPPASSSIAPSAIIDTTSLQRHNAHGPHDPTGRRAFFRQSTKSLTSTAAIAVASATVRPRAALAASSTPSLGAPAPEFSLVNTRGQTVTLDSLSSDGKWTVLYFYPGAFTSGCTIEARKFQEDLPLFRESGAQVVGVSVDSVAKNSEFCTSEGLDFFMLTDEGGKVSKAYGTSLSIPGFGTFSNRQTYIIDPQKKVRWVFVDVESHIPKHSREVLEKLKEVQQA